MNFNWDNRFIQGMGKIIDIYLLGLLWFVLCIPLVTAASSTTALYYTVHKCIRGNRGYVFKNFFEQFKDHFFDSAKISVIFVLIVGVLEYDKNFGKNLILQENSMGITMYIFMVLELFILVWALWTLCYRARFEQTWKASMKNGIVLFFAHLPWTLLIMLILAVSIVLTYFAIYWMVVIPILPVLPALVALLYDIIMEPIFRRYMTEEELELEHEYDMERKKD